MINKNLFVGPLGKLQHIGGSKAFTTPNTVAVSPDYSVKVNDNIQGDLVVLSRDGRLWFFRKNNILAAIALKWNTKTSRLEFAASSKVKGNTDTFIANGKDWLLTNNNIFMVTDEEPYILSAKLWDDNMPEAFLYSVLRANGVGSSAIDTFTNQAWGKREDNGNSDGKGLFSKNNHLLYPKGTHTFEQCYSLLPAVGDWQIFENFLIRRPDNPFNNSYHFMLNLRPLIPLEFCGNNPVYGTGYNFDHRGIQLAYSNGQIWGRGRYHIGRVSLLPAVFDENGEPVEFYLYISPDFPLIGQFFDLQYFNGHSFKVVHVSGNWSYAKSFCEAMGGHLATSTSQEKNNFLASLTEKIVWIGGTDEAEEGSWRWINGEAWSYSNWFNGYPDNAQYQEHYLELNYGGTGLWNDNKDYAIREGFICEWDSLIDSFPNASFLDLGLLLGDNSNVAGVLMEQSGALSNTLCSKASQPVIFNPENMSWLPLQKLFLQDEQTLDNLRGSLWLDAAASEALYLHDEGAALLSGSDEQNMKVFNCRTLNQWFAPAGIVSAVSDDFILAETDKSMFMTFIASGFNRQILPKCALPLSWVMASDNEGNIAHRLAVEPVSVSSKITSFDVHSLNISQQEISHIEWQDIYKSPIEVKLVNFFTHDSLAYLNSQCEIELLSEDDDFGYDKVPIFISSNVTETVLGVRYHTKTLNWTRGDGTVIKTAEVRESPYITVETIETDRYANFDHVRDEIYEIPGAWSFSFFYINPENGQPQESSVTYEFPHNLRIKEKQATYYWTSFDGTGGIPQIYYYSYYSLEESTIFIPQCVAVYNGQIGISAYIYGSENYRFFPIENVPETVKPYIPDVPSQNPDTQGSLYLEALRPPKYEGKIYNKIHNVYGNFQEASSQYIYGEQSIKSPLIAEFRESFSGSRFFCALPSDFQHYGHDCVTIYRPYRNFFDWRTLNANGHCLEALHVVLLRAEYYISSNDSWTFLVFKSKINPNEFDFKAESERSLPS